MLEQAAKQAALAPRESAWLRVYYICTRTERKSTIGTVAWSTYHEAPRPVLSFLVGMVACGGAQSGVTPSTALRAWMFAAKNAPTAHVTSG